MNLKQKWYTLQVFLGSPICPECGSSNIVERGYEGINHRHDCKDCGIKTRFD
jgi:transposase-like protein